MFTVIWHDKAEAELKALPIAVRIKLDRLIGKLEENPRLLREPDTRPLGNGLYEVRTMGSNIARGLWVYQAGSKIYLLRIFIKKTQKTPRAETDLAWQRLEEMKREI